VQEEELKRVGLKVTSPRLKVLRIMEHHADSHLSADEVHRLLIHAGEEIAPATVYRVLSQFEQAGLVARHNFEGNHAVFEVEQGEHHDHLVCSSCGRVEEFLDPLIEQRQLAIAREHGFTMTSHSLHIIGLCHHCSETARQQQTANTEGEG
jgi:Fur family ferric uptake transcriptional regulator